LQALGIAATAAGTGTVAGSSTRRANASGSVDGEAIDPDERDLLHEDVTYVRVGDDLKSLTRNWPVLAADDDVVFGHLDETGYEDSEAAQARETIKEYRRRYPVETSKRDGNLHLELATGGSGRRRSGRRSAGSVSTEDNPEDLAAAAEVVNDGFAKSRAGNSVETEWKRNHHGDISWHCADVMDISSFYESDIRSEAKQPDSDDYSAPDSVSDMIGSNFFKKTIHSEKHYYNPSTGLGSAPQEAKDNFEDAKNNADRVNQDPFSYTRGPAYEKTAYASHYVADCGQPLHTGMEWWQASDYIRAKRESDYEAIHYRYAKWARDEVWPEEKDNYTTQSWYPFSDLQDATENLAEMSSEAETVFWEIYNNDTWRHDYNLRQITENRFQDTCRYLRGMFHKIESRM